MAIPTNPKQKTLHIPNNTEIHPMKEIFPYYSIGHFIHEPDNPTAKLDSVKKDLLEWSAVAESAVFDL